MVGSELAGGAVVGSAGGWDDCEVCVSGSGSGSGSGFGSGSGSALVSGLSGCFGVELGWVGGAVVAGGGVVTAGGAVSCGLSDCGTGVLSSPDSFGASWRATMAPCEKSYTARRPVKAPAVAMLESRRKESASCGERILSARK